MRENRTSGRGPARGAFTLVEMLVAIAITLIFGVMAATTLRYGAGMWRDGHRRSYAYDTATVVFQQVQDDLSAAKNQFWGNDTDAHDTRVKFWADFDADNVQRLRFVRSIPDYSTNQAVRAAGTVAGATGLYNLMGNTSSDLQPLEGMCEVAYLMGLGNDGSTLPSGANANTSRTTLYRAVLAPIGVDMSDPDDAGQSFFEASDASAAPGNIDTLGTSARIQTKALPLAEGVIYFGVRLWSQYTTTWQPSLAGYGAVGERTTPNPAAPYVWPNSYTPADAASAPPDGLGALFTWDSDRIDSSAVGAPSTPTFLLDWDQSGFIPPLASYAVDPAVVTDNVFPRAVMVTVTIEPPSELAVANPLHIVGDITAADTTFTIAGNAPPFNTQWPYVKIDGEWIRVTSIQGNTIQVQTSPNGRGARGTVAAAHSAGANVQIGYTFSRIFGDPAVREYWAQ